MFAALKSIGSRLRSKIQQRDQTFLDLFEMETLNYIRKFNELENKHSQLHCQFIALKSKVESGLLISADYYSRADELEQNLHEAITERYLQKFSLERPEDQLLEATTTEKQELRNELINQTVRSSNSRTVLCQSKDKSMFKENLKEAQDNINSLTTINNWMQETFQEINKRHELGESSKEDFERMADIEGQLIVSGEELQVHRNIINALTFKKRFEPKCI